MLLWLKGFTFPVSWHLIFSSISNLKSLWIPMWSLYTPEYIKEAQIRAFIYFNKIKSFSVWKRLSPAVAIYNLNNLIIPLIYHCSGVLHVNSSNPLVWIYMKWILQEVNNLLDDCYWIRLSTRYNVCQRKYKTKHLTLDFLMKMFYLTCKNVVKDMKLCSLKTFWND